MPKVGIECVDEDSLKKWKIIILTFSPEIVYFSKTKNNHKVPFPIHPYQYIVMGQKFLEFGGVWFTMKILKNWESHDLPESFYSVDISSILRLQKRDAQIA